MYKSKAVLKSACISSEESEKKKAICAYVNLITLYNNVINNMITD